MISCARRACCRARDHQQPGLVPPQRELIEDGVGVLGRIRAENDVPDNDHVVREGEAAPVVPLHHEPRAAQLAHLYPNNRFSDFHANRDPSGHIDMEAAGCPQGRRRRGATERGGPRSHRGGGELLLPQRGDGVGGRARAAARPVQGKSCRVGDGRDGRGRLRRLRDARAAAAPVPCTCKCPVPRAPVQASPVAAAKGGGHTSGAPVGRHPDEGSQRQ